MMSRSPGKPHDREYAPPPVSVIMTDCPCFVLQKGVGDPNPFTVRQMPFFRRFISKVCRKSKVSEGISKKIKKSLKIFFIFVILLSCLLYMVYSCQNGPILEYKIKPED